MTPCKTRSCIPLYRYGSKVAGTIPHPQTLRAPAAGTHVHTYAIIQSNTALLHNNTTPSFFTCMPSASRLKSHSKGTYTWYSRTMLARSNPRSMWSLSSTKHKRPSTWLACALSVLLAARARPSTQQRVWHLSLR